MLFLIVAYFIVAIWGFAGAFWTTNYVWMMFAGRAIRDMRHNCDLADEIETKR